MIHTRSTSHVSNLLTALVRANRLANRHAGKLLALGLGLVALYNWRLWQWDKVLLAKKTAPEPAPSLEVWPRLPKVSVLVAAWNEADNIERHIKSFLDLRYPHKELVVCAGGKDGTLKKASAYACEQVLVLEQRPCEGKHRALVSCLSQATGEVVFLTDADCLFANSSFEETIQPVVFEISTIATGLYKPLPEQVTEPSIQVQWAPAYYLAMASSNTEAKGVLGANSALLRTTLEEAWSYHAIVSTGTDYYLSLRARMLGHSILRVPNSIVETKFPDTVRDYARQQNRWLRNLLYWSFRYRDVYHMRVAIIGTTLSIGMLGLPILVPWLGSSLLSLYIALWFHVIAARLRYVGCLLIGESLPFSGLHVLVQVLVFSVIDHVARARAGLDMISMERRRQW